MFFHSFKHIFVRKLVMPFNKNFRIGMNIHFYRVSVVFSPIIKMIAAARQWHFYIILLTIEIITMKFILIIWLRRWRRRLQQHGMAWQPITPFVFAYDMRI